MENKEWRFKANISPISPFYLKGLMQNETLRPKNIANYTG